MCRLESEKLQFIRSLNVNWKCVTHFAGNFFSSQMSLRSGWSRSAASCGSALNTSAQRLSCPGDFWFSRDLMAVLVFSWGISVDIQVSRCLLYICFCWWWFVCSEFHSVLLSPACYIFCLACKLVYEYLLVCSCHSLHYLARFPLLYCWFISLSLGLKDFLLQSSSVFNGFSGILCDPLLPLPLLCSKAGFAGLLVGYLKLLPLCIDVSWASLRLVFSICQYLELILQLDCEGNLYFKVSQLLHVRVSSPSDWIMSSLWLPVLNIDYIRL